MPSAQLLTLLPHPRACPQDLRENPPNTGQQQLSYKSTRQYMEESPIPDLEGRCAVFESGDSERPLSDLPTQEEAPMHPLGPRVSHGARGNSALTTPFNIKNKQGLLPTWCHIYWTAHRSLKHKERPDDISNVRKQNI